MSKASILFFDSSKTCRILKGKVEDGHIFIENKAFNVDTSEPLMMKKWRSSEPLYILKWNDITPSKNINPSKIPTVRKKNKEFTEIGNVERSNPEFESDEKVGLTPELYRKLIGMRILGNMIKTKKKTPMSEFMMLGLGAVAGMLILWSLKYFQVINF